MYSSCPLDGGMLPADWLAGMRERYGNSSWVLVPTISILRSASPWAAALSGHQARQAGRQGLLFGSVDVVLQTHVYWKSVVHVVVAIATRPERGCRCSICTSSSLFLFFQLGLMNLLRRHEKRVLCHSC